MFPLSEQDRLEFKDEQTGVTFLIKPVCGSNECDFLTILAKNKQGVSLIEQLPFINEMFDFFITGWAPGVFPSDGHPSALVNYRIKSRVITAAMRLNNLTEAEIKN